MVGLVERLKGEGKSRVHDLGCGLGRHLLTCAVEVAWAIGASRVWLHTCTLDDPAALPNYLARGFTPYKTERYLTEIDVSQSGPGPHRPGPTR